MTLKKCTVTRLRNNYYEIAEAGGEPFLVLTRRRPDGFEATATEAIGCWICTTENAAIDLLLSDRGLTRHDKPETAEERMRAAVANPDGLQNVALFKSDLRAVLAELDRLRDAYDAQSADLLRESRLSDDLKSALRMPGHGSYVEYAKEVRAEIDRLRAQRQVDVDAVLAPFRELVARGERRMREADGLGRHNAEEGSYRFAAEDFHNASEWFCVVDAVKGAIAEAEKIGGGGNDNHESHRRGARRKPGDPRGRRRHGRGHGRA